MPDEGFVPVYRTIKGFPAKSFRKLIKTALESVDDCCPESLPTGFRIRNHLCELNFAIRQAHFPDDLNALQIARRRLSFEQILIYLSLALTIISLCDYLYKNRSIIGKDM